MRRSADGPARPAGYARRVFYRALRRALSSDAGREILRDCLEGLAPRLPVAIADFSRPDNPYPELATAAPEGEDAGRRAIVITARFRSGSTLLWRLFRALPECTAYYEPLNERRWFDPTSRGERTDPTHDGVVDYWKEYDGLAHLASLYNLRWTDRKLYMDEEDWDPALVRYIQTLIDAAKGRPVLQFNRVDFRLPWLRRHFPTASFVHLYRHPRDQWCSSMYGDPVPLDASCRGFAGQDHFYLRTWARDLRARFPFLNENAEYHPYRLFYLIWKLSYAYGRACCDVSIRYESLASPSGEGIRSLLAALNMDVTPTPMLARLIAPDRAGRWVRYATDAWFSEHERAADALLRAAYRQCERSRPISV